MIHHYDISVTDTYIIRIVIIRFVTLFLRSTLRKEKEIYELEKSNWKVRRGSWQKKRCKLA